MAPLSDELFELKAQQDKDVERPWLKGSKGDTRYPSKSEKKAKSRRQGKARSRNLRKK